MKQQCSCSRIQQTKKLDHRKTSCLSSVRAQAVRNHTLCNEEGHLGCLALCIIEVGWYGDNGMLDCLAQESLSSLLHLGENHGADLRQFREQGKATHLAKAKHSAGKKLGENHARIHVNCVLRVHMHIS